jgi:hypothetical protein
MFKVRNLLGVGIAIVTMLALTTAGAFAQPAQQATATPEATATIEATVAATQVATSTATLTPTSVAPTVSPRPTAISTPSTLPTTGGSDDGTAALSLFVLAVGAVLLLGGFGLALSRRPH